MPKARKSVGKFRNSRGQFTSRKKWEKENLPKVKRKAVRKRGKFREGKSFITKRFGYEYRKWTLEDFAADTLGGVIGKVEQERRPHPVAFYVHIEYEDDEGEVGDVGTNFFKFRKENTQPCEDVCWGLVNAYGVSNILAVEMLATYALKYKGSKRGSRRRAIQSRGISKKENSSGRGAKKVQRKGRRAKSVVKKNASKAKNRQSKKRKR